MTTSAQLLPLALLCLNGLQARKAINEAVVAEYREALEPEPHAGLGTPRRHKPYHRVLGAALAMSAAEQRQLLREIRSRLQGDSKKWLPSPTSSSSGDGRGGAR